MTPKEKAEDFYSKYYNRIEHALSEDVSGFEKDIVKHLVLIAVDEIIFANPHSNPFNTEVYSTMEYWQEVKQEIEKL